MTIRVYIKNKIYRKLIKDMDVVMLKGTQMVN